MVQTYNEFKVTFDREGKKIIDKTPTKRGTVRINEQTAKVNNTYVNSTKLLYELAKKEPETPKEKTDYRIKLEAKANELKVKFNPKLGDVKLLERIVKVDPEFKVETE
jgi:hypothetical protein